MSTWNDADVKGFMTLQFASGGLIGAKPVGTHIHLVRSTSHGTPGPTLCNLDRFHPDSAGWSVGGGLSGPGLEFTACPACVSGAATYGGLPIGGMFASLFRKAGS